MEIRITTTPALQDLMARLGSDVQEGIHAGLTNLTAEIEARAVKATPVKTSNLVNSITSFVIGNQGVIRATAPYASFVHDGTAPHIIRPKNKKALAWPGGGHPVKGVKHPGTKGKPFFDIAVSQIDPQKAFGEGIQNFLTQRGW
ncbi:MAG: HK97 gp10 family phage protein [Nitrospiraceae bacterium]|nr:HK97 gp10 family phage protein [Nitrospiraceae bacterium]